MRLLLLIVFFVSGVASFAQSVAIAGVPGDIYSDIEPDTLIGSGNVDNEDSLLIDINNDNKEDIRLYIHIGVSAGTSSFRIKLSSLNSSTAMAFGYIDSTYNDSNVCGGANYLSSVVLKMFRENDTIAQSDSFVSVGYLQKIWSVCGHGESVDGWKGLGDGFLGVRYVNSSDTSYGWVKIEVTNKTQAWVREYSLGSVSIGIPENEKGKINVYPNPTTGIFTTKADRTTIIDLTGKVRFSTNEKKIDLSSYPGGIYFIRSSINGSIFTSRLIKR